MNNIVEGEDQTPQLSTERTIENRGISNDINKQTHGVCWNCDVNRPVRRGLCSACLVALSGGEEYGYY